jgi:hypothetical protein
MHAHTLGERDYVIANYDLFLESDFMNGTKQRFEQLIYADTHTLVRTQQKTREKSEQLRAGVFN